MTLKNGFDKCSYLFYHPPMDEKIKTWTLRFPAKGNPNKETALFDWPIVLQYDVKAVSLAAIHYVHYRSQRCITTPSKPKVELKYKYHYENA